MTESDPIKGTDIVEKNALGEAIAQAEAYLNVLDKIERGLKGQSKSSGDSVRKNAFKADTESIKTHTDALLKAQQAERGLSETQKLTIETNAKLAALRKQQIQIEKDKLAVDQAAEDSLVRMRIKLRDLNKEYDMGSAGVRDKLQSEIKNLTNELNKAEQATGRFQRQVGNYHDNTLKFAKGLRGLSGLGKTLAGIFGFDTEAIDKVNEAGKALKEYHHIKEAEAAATKEQAVAHQANAVAIEEEAVATSAATGGLTLLVAGLVAGAIAIWNFVSAKKAQNEIDEANFETNKRLIEDEERSNKLIEEETKLLIKLKVIRKEMSQEDADAANVEIKRDDELKKRRKDYIKELEEEAKARKINMSEIKNSRVPESDIRTRQVLHERGDVNVPTEQYEAFSEEEISRRKQFNEASKKITERYKNDEVDIYKTASIEKKIISAEQLKDDGDNAKRRVEAMEEGIKKDLAAEQLRYNDELKHAKEHGEDLSLVWLVHREKMHEINDKYDQIELKLEDEKIKKALELYKKDTENYLNELKKKYDANKKRVDDETALYEKIDERNFKETHTAKEILDREKKKELAELEKNFDIQKDDIKAHEAFRKEIVDHYALKEKEQKAQQLKEMADLELNALSEMLKVKSDLQLEALRTDSETLKAEAQVQATLAASGAKNSLDAVLKAEAKAAQEQKALQRKQAQEQEALALAKLFIDAESAYMKAGSNPTQAATQALASVLLAKGIAAGISGAFFDGTADTGGPGGIDNKGGKLAILHPHEAVIPEARNRQNPGLAKAWIDGDLDKYLMSIYMPTLSIRDDLVSDQKISEAMADKIITGVTAAIMNQPKALTYKQGHDTIIEETVGGNKKTRIIKDYPIIPRS